MPAKTPIYLKSTNSKKGKKCRLRDILSPDMISPPLGDFRHTVHIGKGGERDAFGDMSFLQGNFELLSGKERAPLQYAGHSEYLRANSASDACFSETPSPVLKNAISLPAIGGSQALTLPLIPTAALPPHPDPFNSARPPSRGPPDGTEATETLCGESLPLSLDVLRPNPAPAAEREGKTSFLFDCSPAVTAKLAELTETKKPGENRKAVNGENGYGGGTENGYDTPPPAYTNSNGGIRHVTAAPEPYASWLDCDGMRESRICDFDFELCKGKSLSQDSISKITGSLLSLELDLGPSFLDDVLNIMDRP
ncbi:cdc42 effector protein 3 [Anguilla anguilla]|uniref:cdc42 effector protein 3 n=1 Tax=Anguilla anguilla TaxID=7936 RepID=UPI0015A8C515|nr:cdc42 effector protein 3 [Anguilla anguilla]